MDEQPSERTILHSVAWFIDRDGWLGGEMHCAAAEGADCRKVCSEGCESWPCEPEHELTDNGSCNAVEWVDQALLEESYGGGRESLHDGPVTVKWEGDYWSWEYADDPSDPQPSEPEPKMVQIQEQVIADPVSELTLTFWRTPAGEGRLRITGNLPLGNRDFQFDQDGTLVGTGIAVGGIPTSSLRLVGDDPS